MTDHRTVMSAIHLALMVHIDGPHSDRFMMDLNTNTAEINALASVPQQVEWVTNYWVYILNALGRPVAGDVQQQLREAQTVDAYEGIFIQQLIPLIREI